MEQSIFPFKLPEIQIANNSPHVTPISVSLSMCEHFVVEDDTIATNKKNRFCLCTMQNLNTQICYKRSLSFKFVWRF